MPNATLSSPRSVDVVVPVHDEAAVLRSNVTRLHAHLTATIAGPWRITIADNASSDRTLELAHELAADLGAIRVLHRQAKGRGGALRQAWSTSEAEVLAYVDADLSTDLDALPPLLEEVADGRADLAIASRLLDGAQVQRSASRDAISRSYNLLVRAAFSVGFRDAQCGCKVISAAAAADLLPQVEDDGWFFDTELLLLAERHGFALAEHPVRWVEDPDSSVRIVRTALGDLRGLARMAATRRRPAPPLVRQPR